MARGLRAEVGYNDISISGYVNMYISVVHILICGNIYISIFEYTDRCISSVCSTKPVGWVRQQFR